MRTLACTTCRRVTAILNNHSAAIEWPSLEVMYNSPSLAALSLPPLQPRITEVAERLGFQWLGQNFPQIPWASYPNSVFGVKLVTHLAGFEMLLAQW